MSRLRLSIFVSSIGFLCTLVSCSRGDQASLAPRPSDGSAAGSLSFLQIIERAEDLRRQSDLPIDAQSSHDPAVRRATARALSRILDPDDAPLLRALEDEDAEVAAWAGYGLGEACKGRADAHVKALAARLGSVVPLALPSFHLDPAVTIVRAIGRCGGERAEPILRAWLRSGALIGEAAAYALGDLVGSAGSLSAETTSALLEAAQDSPPLLAALYPFGRMDSGVSAELSPRLTEIARDALDRPVPERIFAVRALGRAGDAHAAEALSHLLTSDADSPSERAEAAHALARLHGAGQTALAASLAALAADGPTVAQGLLGPHFGILLTILGDLGDDAAKKVENALWTLARLDPGEGAAPARIRRASALRCLAAEKLARGNWDSDILSRCDLADGEAGERARLSALDRSPLVRPRLAVWRDLARSTHVRVREAALEMIARHPELGADGRLAVAQGLSANEAGVVATSANVVKVHPERVFVLAARERRAALDPRAPPPSAQPMRELDSAVGTALRAALAHPWSDDEVETRVALLDAALAAGVDDSGAYANAACEADNATVRARAAKALAAAGNKDAVCPAPANKRDPAPEVGHSLDKPTRIVFDTDARALAVRFDPVFAPVAVTRLVALARSGFFTGIVVHRVVPGFVAQFGDRGGDGFGGSGDLLRCETSPIPFAALDVGVALAGRDTGSSQIFVTLARTPHLDGEYAWVGRAEGDWNAVAEGDVVRAVRVEP